MAGFADGVKNDAERAELRRIAQGLSQDRVKPAAPLHAPELRQLAYEMTV
jgi:hypothetical protein